MYDIRTKDMPEKRIVDIHFELESFDDYKEMYKVLHNITLAGVWGIVRNTEKLLEMTKDED